MEGNAMCPRKHSLQCLLGNCGCFSRGSDTSSNALQRQRKSTKAMSLGIFVIFLTQDGLITMNGRFFKIET